MKEVTATPRIGPLKAWIFLSEENPQQTIKELCATIDMTDELKQALLNFFASEESRIPNIFRNEKKKYERTLCRLVELAEEKMGYYEIGSITINRLLSRQLQEYEKFTSGMKTEEKRAFCSQAGASYPTISAWKNSQKTPMAQPFCALANALNFKITPAFFPSFTDIGTRFSSAKDMEAWLLSFNKNGPSRPELMTKDRVSLFIERKRALIQAPEATGNKARQIIRNRNIEHVIPLFINWFFNFSQSNKKLFDKLCFQADAEPEFVDEILGISQRFLSPLHEIAPNRIAKRKDQNYQILQDLIRISISEYGFRDSGYTNYADLIDFLMGDFEVLKITNNLISEFSHISAQTLVSWNTNESIKPKDVYLYSIAALYESIGLSLDLKPMDGCEAREFQKGLEERKKEREKQISHKNNG